MNNNNFKSFNYVLKSMIYPYKVFMDKKDKLNKYNILKVFLSFIYILVAFYFISRYVEFFLYQSPLKDNFNKFVISRSKGFILYLQLYVIIFLISTILCKLFCCIAKKRINFSKIVEVFLISFIPFIWVTLLDLVVHIDYPFKDLVDILFRFIPIIYSLLNFIEIINDEIQFKNQSGKIVFNTILSTSIVILIQVTWTTNILSFW